MIQLTTSEQATLSAPILRPRDFIEIRARNISDNSPAHYYIWSGVEAISHRVIDPFTGRNNARTWLGAGQLVGVGAVARVSDLTISRTTIRLSNVSSHVNNLIRGHNVKYTTVIFYRSFLGGDAVNPDPARCRFSGIVDTIEFTDEPDGLDGSVDIVCKSSIQDLTRTNPATRSYEYQKARAGDDGFFRYYAASMGSRKLDWGGS